MSHNTNSRMGQRMGQRQGNTVNPQFMSQQQYEQEIKKQIEEKKIQRMQEQMQDQKEIIDHYKNANMSHKDTNPAASNEDLRRIIQEKEKNIKQFDQMMKEQQANQLNIMSGINPSIPNMNFNRQAEENKAQQQRQGSANEIPQHMQRPQFIVDQVAGPIGQPSNANNNSVFGSGNDSGPMINQKQFVPPQNAQNIENPFLTLNNQNQMPQNNNPSSTGGENERERRLRLRDMERQRRNQGMGDEGLKYGAAQGVPAQSFKPDNQNIFGENAGGGMKREEMLQMKMEERQMQQRLPIAEKDQVIQPPQYEPVNVQHLQQQVNKINQVYSQQPAEQQPIDLNSAQNAFISQIQPNQARSGSKTKEIDTQANNEGFMQFGSQVDEKRRENDKRERQAEYQAFLEKQKKGKTSPNRMRQLVESARKQADQQYFTQQQQSITSSPNKQHRHIRSNSTNREQPLIEQNNMIGQPTTAPSSQQFHQRSNSVSRAMAPQYDTAAEIKSQQQEEKLRKQKEYKEYLDMQKSQTPNPLISQKQPSSRPPSSSFIGQSKSVRDEQYLVERRQQLGDQVFGDIINSNRGNSAGNQPIQQQFVPSQRERQSSGSRQDQQTSNMFLNNQQLEEQQKIDLVDKKKMYAMELQQQIAMKKQSALPPKMPGSRPPMHPQTAEPSLQGMHPYTEPNLQAMQMPDMAEPQLPVHLSQDVRFQEILQRKRNEYRQQLDQQLSEKKGTPMKEAFVSEPQQYQGQMQLPPIQMQPPPMQMQPSPMQMPSPMGQHMQMPQSMGHQQMSQQQFDNTPPVQEQQPFDSEADQARIKRELYRKELDLQRQQKEAMQMAQKPQQTNEDWGKEQALPQAPPSGEQGLPQNSRGGRRTDITSEKPQQSDQEKNKIATYQDELRIQIEQQKARKDAEKARFKLEEEQIEREVDQQRLKLVSQENEEIRKEGKRDPNAAAAPARQVNRSQFETSDSIQKNPQQQVQLPPSQPEVYAPPKQQQDAQEYKPFTIPPENTAPLQMPTREQFGLAPESKAPPLDSMSGLQMPTREQFGLPPQTQPSLPMNNDPFLQKPPIDQYMMRDQFSPPQMQYNSQMSSTPSPHDKLLEDQQKMISMYQEALQQILDFRGSFFKEAMGMQMNLMKERDQMMNTQQAFNQQNQGGYPQQPMATPAEGYADYALPIDYSKQAQDIQQINAVRNTLNDLMTKATTVQGNDQNYTSILNPGVQKNLNDFIKGQRDESIRMSQSLSFKQDIHHEERIDAFDQSLNSDSKLIGVPNQFENKLKQKAEDIEQQRKRVTSPTPNPADNKSNNEQHNVTTASGLYKTWINGAESAQSKDRRSLSPNPNYAAGPYVSGNPMHASLAGSSHLQYMNNETPHQNQDRIFSPGGNNFVAGKSPYPNNRATTILAQEAIQELPEREGNLDNTNDYSELEMAENARQVNIAQEQSMFENADGAMKVINMQRSIETDQDFNCRDEDTSQYSKSYIGRKSKVSAFSKANTNQIEKNLEFIESHVNQGVIHQSKSPFSHNPRIQSGKPLSPSSNPGQIINFNYGNASQSKAGGPHDIPNSTAKSFFKGPSSMANTGMAGAPNPKMTGSSFYNATMAKTKIQEQRQQEELQRQLANIFNDDVQKGTTPEVSENQAKGVYVLPADDTTDIDNLSNINIAQSVGQSLEVNQVRESIPHTQHPVNYTMQAAQAAQTNTQLEQYAWLMKNKDNGVINEQEFESKSRDDTQQSKYEKTQSSHNQTMKQSEMVWNDPDLIPDLQEESYSEQFTQHHNNNDDDSSTIRQSQNQVPNSDMNQASMQTKAVRKTWAKQTGNNYNFNESQQSIQSEYNLGMSMKEEPGSATMDNAKKQLIKQIEEDRGRNESNISKLNLVPTTTNGIFSTDGEPGSAAIFKQDLELAQLKLCSPSNQELNFQSISDEKMREERNKQIDDLYDMRNSQQSLDQHQEIMIKETSDIYPPQQRPYNPNFNENPRDQILDSTPDLLEADTIGTGQFNPPASPLKEIIEEVVSKASSHQVTIQHDDPTNKSLASKLDRIKDIFGETEERNPMADSIQSHQNMVFDEERSIKEKLELRGRESTVMEDKRIQFQCLDESQTSPIRENIQIEEPKGTPVSYRQIAPSIEESRPVTQKQRELMELAMLIQAATGSINNVVESSQQFKMLANNKKQVKESILVSNPTGLVKITKKIEEDNSNDTNILSNLDLLIGNLEKQQQENEKVQNKFSSNLGFVSQKGDVELSQKYDRQIDESLNTLPQRDEEMPEEISGIEATQMTAQNAAMRQISGELQVKKQMEIDSNNIRETITDTVQQIKFNQRPISSKSHISNSTRYEQSSKMKQRKQYEDFNDDDDEEDQNRPETTNTQQIRQRDNIGYE